LLLLLLLEAAADAMVMLREMSVAANPSAAGKGQVSMLKVTCSVSVAAGV
jgi:hypothetical protein